MMKKLKGLLFKEEGQALTEYGLILGLIAVVVIGVVALLGGKIKVIFEKITASL